MNVRDAWSSAGPGERRDHPMQIKTFKDMYIAELQELVSVESQLDIALKRMADSASHPSLKRELNRHREETKAQSKRLNRSCRIMAPSCAPIPIRQWRRS